MLIAITRRALVAALTVAATLAALVVAAPAASAAPSIANPATPTRARSRST